MPLPISNIAKALEKFMTNPMRRMMGERTLPDIIQYTNEAQPKRLYLGGSFASKKPDPGDIDIMSYFPKSEPSIPLREKISQTTTSDLHPIERSFPKGYRKKQMKEFLEVGKQRYGSDYNWVRLLTPIATAINALMSGETFDPVSKYLQGERGDL